MTDLLDTMREIQTLNFIGIIWGGGALSFLVLFVLTKMGGDPAGMRQLKRGSIFGVSALILLTIVMICYSVWYINY